ARERPRARNHPVRQRCDHPRARQAAHHSAPHSIRTRSRSRDRCGQCRPGRASRGNRARRHRQGVGKDALQQDCGGEAAGNELPRAEVSDQEARNRIASQPPKTHMSISLLIDFLCRSGTTRRAQSGAHSPSPDTATALRTIANFLLIALFVQLAFDSIQHFMYAATLSSSGMLAVNGLILGLFLCRREAKSETTSAALWLLGYTGTMLPLLMRPSEPPGRGMAGAIVELAGLAMLT